MSERKDRACGCSHLLSAEHTNAQGGHCLRCSCELNRAGQAGLRRTFSVTHGGRGITVWDPQFEAKP